MLWQKKKKKERHRTTAIQVLPLHKWSDSILSNPPTSCGRWEVEWKGSGGTFHEAFKEVVPLLRSNRNNLTCTLLLQFPGNSRFCENTNDTDYQEVFTQASKPSNKGSRRSVTSHLQLTTCHSCGGSAATKAIKLPINDPYTTGDIS